MTEAFVRLAIAIVLDACAFVIWDVGTRAPLRLLSDIRTGLRRPLSIRRGAVRFAVGLAAVFAAAAIAMPVAARVGDVTVVEFLTLIAALAVEQLVGPDLRRYQLGVKR